MLKTTLERPTRKKQRDTRSVSTRIKFNVSGTYINDERNVSTDYPLEITYKLDKNPYEDCRIDWDELEPSEDKSEDDSSEMVLVGGCSLSGLEVKTPKNNPDVICLGESKAAPGTFFYKLKEDCQLDSEGKYAGIKVTHSEYEYIEDAWDDYNPHSAPTIYSVKEQKYTLPIAS